MLLSKIVKEINQFKVLENLGYERHTAEKFETLKDNTVQGNTNRVVPKLDAMDELLLSIQIDDNPDGNWLSIGRD